MSRAGRLVLYAGSTWRGACPERELPAGDQPAGVGGGGVEAPEEGAEEELDFGGL